MPFLIKVVAIVAALTTAVTIWFIVLIGQAFGRGSLLPSGAFGILTSLGWGITLVAGPIAAIQLWRMREAGRRAGIVLFGYALLYCVGVFPAFRWAQASAERLVGAAIVLGVPLGVLLSRRAHALCSAGH